MVQCIFQDPSCQMVRTKISHFQPVVTFVMEVTIVNRFVVKNSKFISCFFAVNCAKIFGPQEKLRPKRTIHTRMHSSRMRTARSSSRPGGSPSGTPRDQAHPHGTRPPPGTRHPPPVNRISHACKNITFPQLR